MNKKILKAIKSERRFKLSLINYEKNFFILRPKNYPFSKPLKVEDLF